MEFGQVVPDATTVVEIVQSLAERLKANYVFPDVAEQICARLQYHLDVGAYADIPDGEFLAFALTTHLQEVNQDEHLWVKWTPEPLPEHEGALRENEAWLAERQQRARLENFGLHKVERLPGNVGYLDIRRFEKPEWGGDTAVATMRFLAQAQALDVAYGMALEWVLERAGDVESGPFLRLVEEAEATHERLDTLSAGLTRR